MTENCTTRRASAICSLWKIYECLFIPNCTRKIIWLLVHNIQVIISVTLQYLRDKYRQQATSTLLDENMTCEIKRKNSFTLSKSCMKTEQLSFTVKSSVTHSWIEELEHKAKEKFPTVLMRLVADCFSSGWQTVCKILLNFDRNTEKQS